jgi:hypothetical protein
MPSGPARLLLAALLALIVVPAPAGAHGAGGPGPMHVDTPREIPVDLARQVRAARFSDTIELHYLPTTWCGAELTSDDAEHSTLSSGQPFYKLVYAHASDRSDRFEAWKDVLQADVSLIGQFMAQQDGATKAPRFDMGTSCGPGYVDIQVVHLPGTRSYYAGDFDRIASDVDARLGTADGPRNVVILADGLSNDSYLFGLGQRYRDDDPGPGNLHNLGGLHAILFPPVGYDPAVAPGDEFYPGFWPEGMLHEITHTLGAVQDSAPNTSLGGHCTDGSDVMCYDDGGPNSGSYSATVCSLLSGTQAGMTQTYDCNNDDYFDPDPLVGSYLDTHWNVFDNVFEAPCPTIGDACGSDGTSVPVSVDPPRVLGTLQAGRTLTGDHGTWSGSPDAFGYQWQRTPVGGGTPVDVAGATGRTYVLGDTDVGRRLRVVVVAGNPVGDSPPAGSALSGAVIAAPTSPSPETTTPIEPTPLAPVTPPADVVKSATISLKRGKRTVLKVRLTSRTSTIGQFVTVPARKVKLAHRGSYRLTVCAGTVCITKSLKARHGKAKLPSFVVATTKPGAVTLSLIGAGGRATGALT